VSSQHTSPCKEDITGHERKAQLKTHALFTIRYNTLLHLVTEESHEMNSCLFVCLFFGGLFQPQGRERGELLESLEKRNLAEAPLLPQPKGFSSANQDVAAKGCVMN
jgi:hypothetical protein